MGKYEDFLDKKTQLGTYDGFEAEYFPDEMFDFQRSLVSWAVLKGRSALFADTGLGKTLMQLTWAENVVRKTNKPVLVLTPLAVGAQTVREGEKFGVECKISKTGGAKPGIIVANYEKLHLFDPKDFSGMVCDECFAAGTKIDVVDCDGRRSESDIENIREGDYILNAVGVDRVSEVHRREVPYAVKVSVGGQSVVCSPNHPFFTQSGWRGAMDLWPGSKILATAAAVRMVQEGLRPSLCPSGENEILRTILLSEMADEPARASGQGAYSGGGCEARAIQIVVAEFWEAKSSSGVSEVFHDKSHAPSGNPRETVPRIEREEPQTFRAWGEWSSDDRGSGRFESCDVRELDGGICFVTGPIKAGVSDELQNRFGERRTENRNRGGWSLSQIAEASGSEERRDADFTRVDSIEVLELGHPDLDRYRDADGKLYFYDIGATRHPSFSVGGLLVHNSAILKSFDGVRRQQITDFMRKMRYRLLCTATPSPNEYIELGTSSEALGYLGYMDMLARFFKNNQGNSIKPSVYRHGGRKFSQLDDNAKWRFKGHAEDPFWQWVCSWARAVRKPSDLGFEDGPFNLPPLVERQHMVDAQTNPDGMLFALPAFGLTEQREERRRTIVERCEKAASLVNKTGNPAILWCSLNDEGNHLEKMIPDAIQISGQDGDEAKEEKFLAFIEGRARVLVTKEKIGAWGLNFQHCAHSVSFPTHSFEAYYQSIRRCWRFGQKHQVISDIVTTEGEKGVLANLQRKAVAADKMFADLIRHMNGAVEVDRSMKFTEQKGIPSWL